MACSSKQERWIGEGMLRCSGSAGLYEGGKRGVRSTVVPLEYQAACLVPEDSVSKKDRWERDTYRRIHRCVEGGWGDEGRV